MHELYKVARADTDKQLYLDFKPIGDKLKLEQQARFDGMYHYVLHAVMEILKM